MGFPDPVLQPWELRALHPLRSLPLSLRNLVHFSHGNQGIRSRHTFSSHRLRAMLPLSNYGLSMDAPFVLKSGEWSS